MGFAEDAGMVVLCMHEYSAYFSIVVCKTSAINQPPPQMG